MGSRPSNGRARLSARPGRVLALFLLAAVSLYGLRAIMHRQTREALDPLQAARLKQAAEISLLQEQKNQDLQLPGKRREKKVLIVGGVVVEDIETFAGRQGKGLALRGPAVQKPGSVGSEFVELVPPGLGFLPLGQSTPDESLTVQDEEDSDKTIQKLQGKGNSSLEAAVDLADGAHDRLAARNKLLGNRQGTSVQAEGTGEVEAEDEDEPESSESTFNVSELLAAGDSKVPKVEGASSTGIPLRLLLPAKATSAPSLISKNSTGLQPGVTLMNSAYAKLIAEDGQEGVRVVPPSGLAPNCLDCPRAQVLDFCHFAAGPLGSLEALLEQDDNKSSPLQWSAAELAANTSSPLHTHQRPFSTLPEKLQSLVNTTLDAWGDAPGGACGLWTRACVVRWQAGEPLGDAGEPDVSELSGGAESLPQFYPDLEVGAWGHCAVVAVSSSLLSQQRGPEIDAHDTVIRFNAPIEGFKADVGSRTDVMFWKKRRNEAAYGQEGQQAERFYLLRDYLKYKSIATPEERQKQELMGKPVLWFSNVGWRFGGSLYKHYGLNGVRRKMSRGFELVSDVLSSRLCSRVDLYGFSAQGNGKYFKDEGSKGMGVRMIEKHLAGLEHWVYRTAMEKGMLCLYD